MSASLPDSRPEPVLVIGEALIDLVQHPGRDPEARVGGSPLNVAIGLSRLDVPAVLWSDIGDDRYADMIERHLGADGVRLVDGSSRPGRTSTALANIGPDGAATYEFALEWNLAATSPALGSPRLVHTGSIGAVLDPGAARVLAALDRLRVQATISYDPNARPQLMGSADAARSRVERLVKRADVVKASDEDLRWLYPDRRLEEVASAWLGLGPALVVVTGGGDGSFGVCRDGVVEVPAHPTRVADTIGAGDSFMAGLLAALADRDLLGRDKEARLRALTRVGLSAVLGFAAACSAVTVARPGADPPRRDALALPESSAR